jgi:hypothetical protein
VVDLELERVHRSIKVDSVEVVQEQNLGISLSSVPGFASFGRFTDFDNDHVPDDDREFIRMSSVDKKFSTRYSRYNMSLELVKSGVDFSVVELPRAFTDRLEQQGLGIELGVDTENVQHNSRGRAIVSASDDISVANDKDQLALVVVVQGCKGVDRPPERFLSLGVAWHLTKNEFVLQFR